MGLPIERIIVATNANDIVARALDERPLCRAARSPRPRARPWTSRSPPISSGSISRRRAATRWRPPRAFAAFAATGAHRHARRTALAAMRELFAGARSARPRPPRTILAPCDETGELIDPHTAVGLAAAARVGPATAARRRWSSLATAHPAKFPEAVRAAAGVDAAAAARASRAWPPGAERIDRLPADASRRSRPTSATSRVVTADRRARVHTPRQRRPLVCDPVAGLRDPGAVAWSAGRGARWEDEAAVGLVAPARAHGVQGRRRALGARHRRGDRGRGRPDQRRHRPRAHQLPGARAWRAACRWPWRWSPT